MAVESYGVDRLRYSVFKSELFAVFTFLLPLIEGKFDSIGMRKIL